MNVQIRSSSGISLVPIESCLLSDRRIFIEGEIDSEKALEFAKQVMHLNSESSTEPIRVYLNTPGGEINSGLLMYDIIRSSPAPIIMYCIGKAYSMGAVLLACGDHGRFILPHGEVMIHEPLISNHIGGSTSSIISISENMRKVRDRMNELLSRHTGRPVEEIESATGFDHYLTAEESVSFGICDRIIDFKTMMEGCE